MSAENSDIHIRMESVTLDIPVFNVNSRSLKNRFLNYSTGGRIAATDKRHLSVRALDNVSLAFNHGDRVALVGRNGAGKTTMLQVLGGIYEPTRGHVRRSGATSTLLDTYLGMVPTASGYENITILGLVMGMTPAEVEARMDEIAEFTELGNFLDLPVQTYSAGMRFRLAFAVRSCIEPDILLMDEWVSTSDPSFVQKVRARMEELVQQSGIFVIASQNLDLIGEICTRGVLLEKGQVKMYAPIEEVIERYGGSTA